jgi:hypothetical protein
MEKTKQTCVYLEAIHFEYLAMMQYLTGLNRSQIIRDALDNEISQNQEVIKEFKVLYNKVL